MAGISRRGAMLVGALAVYVGAWQWWARRPDALGFEPIRDLPGWEFATAGALSGPSGADFATIGLEPGPEPLAAPALWSALHHGTGAAVPVAVFSDFFCPYCRTFVPRLLARETLPPIEITWHELPLLGPASVFAARAAEAAALQDGYAAFYVALMERGFRPTSAAMADTADAAGLDGARLLHDMVGPEVAARLDTSARAASTLGIAGTPGLVIDRRAILGALDDATLDALVQESSAA